MQIVLAARQVRRRQAQLGEARAVGAAAYAADPRFQTGGFHRGHVSNFNSVQQLGLGNVRRHDRRAAQQFLGEILDAGRIQQIRAAERRLHDGIEHDVRAFDAIEKFGDDHGVRAIPQHADLDAGELHVVGQRVKLRAQRGRWSDVRGLHALR